MKKTLAILALALFIGGISVPAIASNYNAPDVMELRDEDPKKKATKSKEAKKSAECTHEEKTSDCTSNKKSESSSTCGEKK